MQGTSKAELVSDAFSFVSMTEPDRAGIPIIVGIGLVLIALLAGTAVAVKVFGEQAKGQKVVLLGPREAGKTTLGQALASGTISKEYISTQSAERYDADLHMKDLHLRVTLIAPGGDQTQYRDWLDQARGAKVVVYLFDVVKVRTDAAYAERAVNGADHVGSWRDSKDLDTNAAFVLLGTHRDLDSDRDSGGYFDEVSRQDPVTRMRRALRPSHVLFVSLWEQKDIEKVLYAIGKAAGS